MYLLQYALTLETQCIFIDPVCRRLSIAASGCVRYHHKSKLRRCSENCVCRCRYSDNV